jgi:hypothetical protein
MSEKQTPSQDIESGEYAEAAQRINEAGKEPNYTARRAGVAIGVGLTLAAGAGLAERAVEHNTLSPIESTDFQIGPGQGVIAAAEDRVEEIFLAKEIDASKIPYGMITEQGQQAQREYTEITGESVKPGETFFITILSNEDSSKYGVEINPAELPTLPENE